MNIRILVAMQAVVSAASLVVEIVAGRMLAPYVGMSLYTWTSVIAVVLAGFSVGHWMGGRLAERPARAALAANGWAMVAAALTTAGAVFLLRASAGPMLALLQNPVAGIVALSIIAFFLPSVFAGIPAPILTQIAVSRAQKQAQEQSGRALGAMFAAGAIGAIAGTLLAGFVFIAWLGSSGTLAVVTLCYALVAAASFAMAGRDRGAGLIAASGALMLAVGAALTPGPCDRESRYFCIRVIEMDDMAGAATRLMVLDHLVHGVSAEADSGAMLTPHGAILDALTRHRMEGRAFEAFFIGGGSFTLPRAWADQTARQVVAEIDPQVTRTATDSFWFDPASAEVRNIDARVALSRDPARYDVIVGDAFTDIAVPPHLITREFFALAASRLNPEGIFVMNVIDRMDRLELVSALYHTMQTAFPVVELWAEPVSDSDRRRIFILLGGASPTDSPVIDGVAQRVSSASLARLSQAQSPILLTDDRAPIERLLGSLR
ncbi:MAG: fused MFS/spermidine synthase [Paracoccus sp. (in: a-proteobacteria)]|nr:fused MFS/spermidine synthase [Paracoccus sp. (in: a-proteobacteria)]